MDELQDGVFENARTGNYEALRKYIENKGDVEARNQRGYSLLMLAAYNQQFRATQLLLEHGAAVNSQDHGGNTVLMGAAFKGLKEIVGLLLSKGADVRIQNAQGMTAMDFAKIFARRDVLTLLSQDDSSSWYESFEPPPYIIEKDPQQTVSP
nr:ankyrin repeat domain-containing protein [uncultured Bdellovibrio sp.]